MPGRRARVERRIVALYRNANGPPARAVQVEAGFPARASQAVQIVASLGGGRGTRGSSILRGTARGTSEKREEAPCGASSSLLNRRLFLGWNGHLLGGDVGWQDDDVDLALPVHHLALAPDEDRRTGLERAAEYEVRERILDVALDRAAQRPRAHRRVVSLLDEQVLRLVRELDRHLVRAHLLAQAAHQQLDDDLDLFLRELVEDDHLVDAVQELRPEHLLQLRHDLRLHVVVAEAAL